MADLKSKQIKFPLTGTSVVSSSAQIATDISGSFVADSGSFSTRVTTTETELSNTLVSSSAQIATDISGSFVADSGSFSTRVTTAESELTNTLISSSAQIATDISGSFRGELSGSHIKFVGGGVSGSLASTGSFGRVEVGTGGIDTAGDLTLDGDGGDIILKDGGTEFGRFTQLIGGLTIKSGPSAVNAIVIGTDSNPNIILSGELQTGQNITGSSVTTGSFGKVVIGEMGNRDVTSVSSSISTRLTTAETELGNTLFSGSAQVDHDSTTNFVANEHIDHTSVSIVAGTGLTGGGTIAANRTLNVIGGTGVTANANDIAIGQAVETTSNVKFNHITGSGNISGSLGDILGYKSGSFNYLETSANISSSGGITVDTITTTATASLASIKLSGESGHISGSLGVITGFTQANITSGSFNYVNASGNVTASKLYGTVGTATQATIDHDSLANFVSDEHVAHGDVSIVAGTGLTGGGTIAANRTLNVIGGTGVTANANDIAIGQDVATTANVQFNHISASGNVSSSGTGSFERLEVGGGGGISLETVTASDTGSFASIELSGESGHLSGSLGLITGFKNIEGTSGSFSYLETTANISSSASGSFLNVNAPHITATNVHGTILTATQATIDHDSLANFVANEHIDHSGVTMTAGAGLTGGGTIAATRTLAVGAGTGVTVNANDVAIGQAVATDSDVEFATITTTGNITVQGDIIAENYIVSSSVTHLTSSAISGSSIFGDTQDDTHQFTGSVFVSGSTFNIDAIGSVSSSNSGSFLNVKATNNVNATNLYGTVLTATQATIDHDSLANFVANEHIDHSAVSVVAGAGLTGGGTIAANRTINVVGGNGITANANDIAITAAQTTIESIYKADLVIGEDNQTQIDFETVNEIHFDVNNVELLNLVGSKISGSQASTGSFGSVVTDANVGIGVANPSVALEVIGSISGSQSGSFLNVDVTDNLGVTGIFTLPNIANVSASIAGAIAGGDDMGNHTATQDLDMDGNDIFDVQHISSSGNISGSAGDILGFDSLSIVSSGSFGTNLGIGTTTPAESLEVIGAISASTSGSFLNLDVDKNINATNLYGTILTATQGTINHDSLAGFVANEHVDHTTITLTAGDGLSGGGTIASNRSFAVDATVLRTTGDSVISSSAQLSTDISGSFVAPSGSFSTRITTAESELGNTLVSSSAQLSTDISGSFVAPSGSFSTRITTAESELSNTLVSSSAQLADDISGSFSTAAVVGLGAGIISGSSSNSSLTTAIVSEGAGILSGSAQISADISGSLSTAAVVGLGANLVSASAQIDHDSATNFVANEHIDHSSVSVVAGAGLTGGGTIAANRTINVVGGTGVTANADDIAIGQDVATTANVTFASVTTTGNIEAEGDVIARNYIVSSSVTHMTSSIMSGSTIFGDSLDDTHKFTGSIDVTGSITIPTGSITVEGGVGGTNIARFSRNVGTARTDIDIHAGGGDPQITFTSPTARNYSIGQDISTNGFKISEHTAVGTDDRLTIADNGDISVSQSLFVTSGDFEVKTGNISGSQASTGSFGSVVTDANVGIGVANPSVALEVKSTADTTIRIQNDTGASDEPKLQLYRNSNAYGQVHYEPGGGANSGLHLTDFRDDANSHIVFNTRGDNERMRIEGDGEVIFAATSSHASIKLNHAGHLSGSLGTITGIKQANITSGSFDYMNVTGNVTASTIETSGDVIAFGSSDRELKDNIQPIENPLEKMEKIGGYTFVWNDKQSTYKGEDIGVVAQEIQSVLPEIVATRANGYLGVKYEKIVPLLIESIKELKKEVEDIKKNCDCLNK